MSQYAAAPAPPNAPLQVSEPSCYAQHGRPTHVPLVPQIAPWTQYMRKPGQAPVLPSIHSNSQQRVTAAPPAVVASSACSAGVTTKRHNPYAAAATSETNSAITSPALGFTAAGKSPNSLSIDRIPSAGLSASAGQRPQQGGGMGQRAAGGHSQSHFGQGTYGANQSYGFNDHSAQNSTEPNHGRSHASERNTNGGRQVTAEEIRQQKGSLLDMAHTANGSVFLQTAIRNTHADTAECIELISAELLPHLGDLLLDSHGCYIIKTLMERMPTAQLHSVMNSQIAPDESLVYSLCTHSLHTRRVVQFLFDTIDCTSLIDTIAARCSEIATTQQGCIVVQRAMDVAVGAQRQRLFAVIQSFFSTFCFDPFANYVLQHMFTVGDIGEVARGVWPQIKGNVVDLSCNKFASNVVEKCLSKFPAELQHELLHEMYDVPEERLLSMLQDSFGNYIVQTSIALAPPKEIPFMRTKLMAVLDRTPYGHKIESRLERRRKINVKGEQGTTDNSNPKPIQRSQTDHRNSDAPKAQHHGHKGRPVRAPPSISPVAPVAEGEEPW